ncbi:hypothetical protein A2U01_0060079, partial [Trifolium medium]|nr:hypothetical protein [Trifolium medium]
LTCEVVLEPNVDDPRLPPRDPAVVSESIVRPTPCIESLPDKDGQATGPVPLEGEHIQEWMDSQLRGRLLWQV